MNSLRTDSASSAGMTVDRSEPHTLPGTDQHRLESTTIDSPQFTEVVQYYLSRLVGVGSDQTTCILDLPNRYMKLVEEVHRSEDMLAASKSRAALDRALGHFIAQFNEERSLDQIRHDLAHGKTANQRLGLSKNPDALDLGARLHGILSEFANGILAQPEFARVREIAERDVHNAAHRVALQIAERHRREARGLPIEKSWFEHTRSYIENSVTTATVGILSGVFTSASAFWLSCVANASPSQLARLFRLNGDVAMTGSVVFGVTVGVGIAAMQWRGVAPHKD